MHSYHLKDLIFILEKQGPLKYLRKPALEPMGKYSLIRTPFYEFYFNLKAEIKFIRGITSTWPHPAAFLKRTDGNDWVFYSVGIGGAPVRSWLGEYYLPCLGYPSNPVWDCDPYQDPRVMNALGAWAQLFANLSGLNPADLPPYLQKFLENVLQNHEGALLEKTRKFHQLIKGRLSVLPPDARHVDYQVIPLNLTKGCLYHCKFCAVKSDNFLARLPRAEINEQALRLKDFLGPDLGAYQGIFLGDHDGLAADGEVILQAAELALETFETAHPVFFMFGSVDSFLTRKSSFWQSLDQLPAKTYINLGLESVDLDTLKLLGKPLSPGQVREGFSKMLAINGQYENITVTANFLLGENLGENHLPCLSAFLSADKNKADKKTTIYFSPLTTSQNRPLLLEQFFELKKISNYQSYIYLIQRL
ncbi:radical SAM protein [Dethiosulfatarculus sandiegensis]|uniref:Radical SAM core domain-containing protein n=1 Tax=Dethiosulfatarculus sandiegensis TaxID=1429043 RepID=A0A0D2J9K4_9BACT|nr:radical SAM protein [Dethiosulfatarculus sandiegensis]KIX14819.1 hypothetical protein X474_06650 [Dethiosulfatarculus sandiegensis]